MYQYKAKLLNVVDADTMDMDVDMGFNICIKQRLRLLGIDAPELNSKNLTDREMAMRAKIFVLNAMTIGETYVIDTYKDDKYGRLLADIFVVTTVGIIINRTTLSNLLLEAGLAKPYT